jgi:hypothetical protein
MPFRALPDRDHLRLSTGLPLMRLATDRSRQTLGLLSPRTSPGLAVTRTSSSDKPRMTYPSWILSAWRFRRIGIAAAAASLQGFNPSADWGAPSPDFSACGVPGSLGLRPPWGIPLPESRPQRLQHALRELRHNPTCSSTRKGRDRKRLASSRHFGAHPLWVLLPVLQSVKELGSRLTSSEVAGPLRFSSSSPSQ